MAENRRASPALEAFIDEAIHLSKAKNYYLTIFQGMRHDQGTLAAIEKLVQSGEVQSGFTRLKELGLLAWSIESAVTKFPDEFTPNARECAEWRLKQVEAESSR
jgi:hypothetical protein